jgi:LCP family protein required for cell wall assembly
MKKVLIILGILLVAIAATGFFIINSYLGKIKYDSGTAAVEPISPETTIDEEPEDGNNTDSPQAEVDDLEQRIRENLENNSTPITYDKDVFNILLIGTDDRKDDHVGRSDSIIIISICKKTSKIIATSLLRDIYLNIPGMSQGHRLNAANVAGGPALLLKTIEENFKIHVDKYVTVNFFSFMKIIDQVGGVTIDISDAEMKVANKYIRQLNKLLELPLEDGVLTEAGEQNMNGKQALGYARIRYVGNADFERTDRQRSVMTKVFNKIKELSLLQLSDLLNILLPEVTTNLSKGELFTLILSVPVYSTYTLDSWYVPKEGSFSYLTIRGMSVIGIDFQENISALQKKIYDKNAIKTQ